jgi:hypothetical protein
MGDRFSKNCTRDPAAVNDGQLSSGYVLTSRYQTTHRANADTITPAQYQLRSVSSLIGSSSLFREGLYTHSLACPASAPPATI